MKVAVCLIFFSSLSALASADSALSSEWPHMASKKSSVESQSYFKPSLSLTNETFLTPSPTKSEYSSEQVLSASLQGKSVGKVLNSKVDAAGAVGLKFPSDYNYVLVPELYVSSNEGQLQNVNIAAGRMKHDWSYYDEFWQQGLWQPRFRWNYINPQQQGLTGLFVQYKKEIFAVTALVSPVFVPEQGPAISDEDGTLKSSSQYFSPAPSAAKLGQASSQINYDIQAPELRKIVFHPTYALKVRAGKEQGVAAGISYANKPMNTFMLAIEPRPLLSADSIDVIIHPFLQRHQLITAETTFTGENALGWVSGTREWVSTVSNPDTWTYQRTSPSLHAGAGADWRLPIEIPLNVGVSYMKRLGGDANDAGDLADPNQSNFESRYDFKDAVSLRMFNRFAGRVGRRIGLSNKIIYELNNQSMVISSQANFQASANLTFYFGGELLSALNKTPSKGFSSDLISRYRGNDRAYAGATYAF